MNASENEGYKVNCDLFTAVLLGKLSPVASERGGRRRNRSAAELIQFMWPVEERERERERGGKLQL